MHQQNIEPTLIEKPTPAPDSNNAALIEQALLIQSCHGTYHAARLLHSKGIGISIALRELARAAQKQPTFTPSALLAPRRYGSVAALMYRHTWT
jgi:hypothetical protein